MVESVDIKDIQGNIRFSTLPDGKRKFLLMKEDYITVKFNLEEPIFFKLGDNVELPDDTTGLFEICDIQKPTYNTSTGGYDYELRLDAYYWKWKNKIFKYTPEAGGQEASWNLTASLDVQLGVFLRNLKALGYTYRGKDFEFSIDSSVENKALLMSYDNTNMIDALSQMAEKWDCEWWITNSIIHFGRCEFGTPVDFELGVNVEEMTRSDSQSIYATRIYAFGSTRNIPINYRPVDESIVVNGVVQKRLMLPADTPYIDAYEGMSQEEAIEDVVIFEDVYPRRIGTVSDITTHEYTDKIENEDGTTTETKWNAYRFKDAGITFSEKYIIVGEELKVKFESGLLSGMEFGVTFNPDKKPEKLEDGSWNPDAQVWEIVRNEDYGRPLPDEVLRPQIEHKEGDVTVPADTYVLSGFDTSFVSDTMIPDAEQELKEKAEAYLDKAKVDPSTYTNKMMSDRFENSDGMNKLLEAGDRVNLINAAYFETGSRQSRIIGFEYNLDIPWDSPVYTVGETASYSRLGEIEDKVDSLTYKGQTYTGAGSGVYVIGTNDTTPATNRNVFSALKSLATLLRKDKIDSTNFLLRLFGGLEVGPFSPGSLGSGAAIQINPLTGKSYLEVDELFVRMKAVFKELVIESLRHIGGELVLSPARMKCVRVEEQDDAYRCYFDRGGANESGRYEVEQEFTAGAQARCQVFTGSGQKYYWRLVTAVGDDYIDLSKTDCDTGSDLPKSGDDICQLGHRSDESGMNAIVLSAYGPDAPSYKQYAYIDSYSLAGKEVSVTSPKGNRYVGDFILKTGVNIATELQILENLIKTEIQSVEYVLNETDNYLLNASFVKDMEGWVRDDDVQVLEAEELLQANSEYLSDAGRLAGVVTYDGKLWLRLKDSYVKQPNANLTQPAQSGKFYVSLRYICTGSGTLACGFSGQGLYRTASIAINRTARMFEFSGNWDGTGDFLIQFTGDIHINLVTLTNRPLDDFKQEVNSSFTQMAGSIKAMVTSIDNINKTIRESGWLTTADGTKIWASACWPDGTRAISLFTVTPEGIFLDSSHINLKGIVTFESFAPDFQTAYEQAFGNASMTAKDDVARQLGYSNYAQLVENAATGGKAVLVGGYLNLELIDVDTLIAGKVLTNKVVTSLNGKRIEIDPETSSIRLFDSANVEVGRINFSDEVAGDGSIWTIPELYLKQTATLNGKSEVQGQIKITPRNIYMIDTIEEGQECALSIDARIGIFFSRNGVPQKGYPAN